MNLFVPNISQTDTTLSAISVEDAKQKIMDGIGVVMYSDPGVSELVLENVSFAYYLKSSTFSAIGQKRVLVPIYVFSGPTGQVAALAEKQ